MKSGLFGASSLRATVPVGIGLLSLAFVIPAVDAKVTKFDILRVESPAFEGRSFGSIGTYDKIVARASVAVAPADRHNANIVDLQLAPRNASGLVEAVSDVEILRPTDPAKANRRLFYEVVNRGRKLSFVLLNDAPMGNDLATAPSAGNGFLMTQGYTIIWSGWQGDTAAGDGRLTFSVPILPNVAGEVLDEFVFDHMTNPVPAPLSYPAADLDPRRATLTVRQREADERSTPADLTFAYEGPNKIIINRPAGFDAGAIYEFIYPARDAKVMGLGFAAARDVVSFLRHERADDQGAPNPLAAAGMSFDHAIGFGVSQSGRYLRDFLYQGFNEDEAGRVVFDGIMPHIAASHKTFINARFAQPGRVPWQHSEHGFPGDQFPFTYPVLLDPVTGQTDGILARCLAAGNCPKIMQTDTESELFSERASLIVTDTRGEPVDLPENVRVYLFSGAPHFARPNVQPVPSQICENLTNPLHVGAPMRALVVSMDAWLGAGTAPPASRYPSRADGTLQPPQPDAVGFPPIPGVIFSGQVNRLAVMDYSVMPARPRTAYPVFIGRTDGDGHTVAGIRLPAIEAPVATHLGWSIRKAGFAQGELCDSVTGSLVPLAKTREERLATNDPRPSLAERYPNAGDYAAAVTKATRSLVKDRLLLDDDAKQIAEAAAQVR